MKNNTKILLEFLLTEGEIANISKSYRFKEDLMQAVQKSLHDAGRADSFNSQEEYEQTIDNEVEALREDLETTLSMIARALYQVPFQAFKK